jgi:hypothetical protein
MLIPLQGPIFEIMLHEPKKAWERHGVPVSINFKDDRGKSIGALHLDFPNDPLQFPCYALFLDPANALIIRSKEFEPFRDDPGKGYPEKPVPKSVLSTEVVQQNIEKHPQLIFLSPWLDSSTEVSSQEMFIIGSRAAGISFLFSRTLFALFLAS